MHTYPQLIVCEHCDSVYRRPVLEKGARARCGCCGAALDGAGHFEADSALALTVAAATAFVIANLCPVIGISLQGVSREATLWQAVAALAHGVVAPIAVPAGLVLIGVPGLQIALLLWLLAHARAGRRAPGFVYAMRWLGWLRPWSMVEVGMLGILVAVIKLAGTVHVVPGAGLWATAALMLLLPLTAGRDVHALWRLEPVR